MKKLTYWLMVAVLLCGVSTGMAQQRNKAYEDYIKKYRSIAVDEMKHYRIPASITLAQGLLESGAGRSELARKSNNHFGIKCGGSWDGRSVRIPTMRPTNVSVLISMRRIRIVTIRSSCVRVRVTLSCFA